MANATQDVETMKRAYVIAILVVACLAFSIPAYSQPVTIQDKLEGKSTRERANIKGDEITKAARTETFTRDGYTVEIQGIEKIDGGLQVFIRAWQGENQLGFGADELIHCPHTQILSPG